MRRDNIKASVLAGLVMAGGTTGLLADLTTSYQFNGKGNWSIDGVGGNGTPVGTLQASVPVGATIERAFLYSSLWSFTGDVVVPTVNFEGTIYSGASWTSLGSYRPDAGTFPNFYLGAFRTDVTTQVASLAGVGSGSLFNWSVDAESPNSNIDGEVLAIVYSLPSETTRTIAFLDGFSTSAGDTTTVTFASPLTPGQLADPSLLSLGIGFSAGAVTPVQSSTVDIDVAGNHLTSSAGGYDDGSLVNGALITVGGIGDNTANPANPASNTSPDDELYTLNPFLSAGMGSFDILTKNPSLDDNIFFAGLNLSAEAKVTTQPPGVPDQASTALLLSALFPGLLLCRRMLGKQA